MGELLDLVASTYSQAPAATRWIAQLSLLLGFLGVAIVCIRMVYLRYVARGLRGILNSLDLPANGSITPGDKTDLNGKWAEIRALHLPRSFRDALHRMDRARSRPVGFPEEAWRAAYEQVLGGEARWETLVRGIASAAVLVGLLGTVAGFADISGKLPLIPGVAFVEKVGDQKGAPEAARSVQRKLGGVFISTICGIFASLMILLLGAPGLRWAADQWLGVVEDIGRLIVIPLLPRPLPDLQDRMIDELQRRISTVAIAWESSLRGPAASLAEVAENSRGSVEAAIKAFDGVRVSVEDLKELGNSAKRIREAAQSIERTAKVYVSASSQLGAAVGHLEATLPGLSGDLKSLSDRLAGLEGVLASGTRFVTESGDALKDAVAKMGSGFQGLREAVASRHERESAFLEQTEQAVRLIAERLKGLEAVEQEIKAEAEQMKLAVAEVAIEIGRALGPLRETIGNAIRDTFGKLMTDHGNILAVAIADSAGLLNKIRSAQEGLLKAVQDVIGAAESLTERGRELDRVARGTGTLGLGATPVSGPWGHLGGSGAFSGSRAGPAPIGGQDDGGSAGSDSASAAMPSSAPTSGGGGAEPRPEQSPVREIADTSSIVAPPGAGGLAPPGTQSRDIPPRTIYPGPFPAGGYPSAAADRPKQTVPGIEDREKKVEVGGTVKGFRAWLRSVKSKVDLWR